MSRRAPADGRARAGGGESPGRRERIAPVELRGLDLQMEYVGSRWAIKGPRCRPFTNLLSLVSTRSSSLQRARERCLCSSSYLFCRGLGARVWDNETHVRNSA